MKILPLSKLTLFISFALCGSAQASDCYDELLRVQLQSKMANLLQEAQKAANAATVVKNPILLNSSELAQAGRERAAQRISVIEGYQRRFGLGQSPFYADFDATGHSIRVFVPPYSNHGRFLGAPASPLVFGQTKARLLILPGMAWNVSDHGLMLELVRTLGIHRFSNYTSAEFPDELPKNILADKLLKSFRNEGLIKTSTGSSHIAAEILEMPGHGVGPEANRMLFMGDTLEFLKANIERMRRENEAMGMENIPIVVMGWSASGPILNALTKKYPKLIDGQVFLAPTNGQRNPLDILAEMRSVYPVMSNLTGFHVPTQRTVNLELNREGLTYYSAMSMQAPAFNPSDLRKIPTLALYSSKDDSVQESTRLAFNSASSKPASEGGFILGKSRLDVDRLGPDSQPPTAGFVLGKSRLNVDRLGPSDTSLFKQVVLDSDSHEPFNNFGFHPEGFVDIQLPAYRELIGFINGTIRNSNPGPK